jgi:hypothetical protein
MISKILLFGFILLCNFSLFAQEKETVVIKKATSLLYRGVLAETKTWYLLVDENGDYYMANLDRPNDTVYDWFVRFKNSQNIYKSQSNGSSTGMNSYPTLHFKKQNDSSDILNFYYEKPSPKTIILTSISDGIVYCFELEVQ